MKNLKKQYLFLVTERSCRAPETSKRLLERHLVNDLPLRKREWMERHLHDCLACAVRKSNHQTVLEVRKRFLIPEENVRAIVKHLTLFHLEQDLVGEKSRIKRSRRK